MARRHEQRHDPTAIKESRLAARRILATVPGGLSLKPRSSAKWIAIDRDWRGVLRARIEHDTLKGVTPEMFVWWISNVAGTTTWDGSDFDGEPVPRYQLWHHLDHESVIPVVAGRDGSLAGFSVGGTSVVSEQMNQTNKKVATTVVTDRLDLEEWNFTIKEFGLTVGRVYHHYSPEPGGLRFFIDSQIGITTPVIGWLLNWLVVPRLYSRRDAENWVVHNVEETGQSEKVIPPLYAHAQSIASARG